MKTLDLILHTLEAFDCIGELFIVERSELITTADGLTTAVEFEGPSEGLPFGGSMKFRVEIEDGDTMNPHEIIARVRHRFEPDYDFSKDNASCKVSDDEAVEGDAVASEPVVDQNYAMRRNASENLLQLIALAPEQMQKFIRLAVLAGIQFPDEFHAVFAAAQKEAA